jgi:hypothetical protein
LPIHDLGFGWLRLNNAAGAKINLCHLWWAVPTLLLQLSQLAPHMDLGNSISISILMKPNPNRVISKCG